MPKLELVSRFKDESFEDYFVRAVRKAFVDQQPFVINIGAVLVDVNPETTVDYLRGYLDGIKLFGYLVRGGNGY